MFPNIRNYDFFQNRHYKFLFMTFTFKDQRMETGREGSGIVSWGWLFFRLPQPSLEDSGLAVFQTTPAVPRRLRAGCFQTTPAVPRRLSMLVYPRDAESSLPGWVPRGSQGSCPLPGNKAGPTTKPWALAVAMEAGVQNEFISPYRFIKLLFFCGHRKGELQRYVLGWKGRWRASGSSSGA